MEKEKNCIWCGETEREIRREGLLCCKEDRNGEPYDEMSRHRFKLLTEKDRKNLAKEEEAICNDMGNFADFVNNLSK